MQDGNLPLTYNRIWYSACSRWCSKRKSYTSLRFRNGDWAIGVNQNARGSTESRTVARAGEMWQVIHSKQEMFMLTTTQNLMMQI